MKKTCVFCSLSSFGTGMPISTCKLAVGLAGRGVDVCVVLPEEGELAERLRGAGIDVGIVPFERLKRDFWKRPWQLLTWIFAGWRLRGYIRGNGVGIAHFSDVIDAPFYPFARLAGAASVAHIRVCVDAGAVRYLYRVWTHLFCSRIVTVSHFVKRYYGFGRRASVVYNPGPDRSVFNGANIINAVPADTNAVNTDADDIPTVIAVSSFRRDKGHHNFLEIASRIKTKISGDVKFIIVGGKVPGHEKYYDEMIDEIKRKGLDGCLTVTGNIKQEEVAAVMAVASVLVHAPDWEEALGGVVLEAMAMGVAVVAYDCGGIGECFTDGESGYLVKRGDINSAADRTAAILESRELRQKTAIAARAELDSKFTMENYISGIEKIYDDVLNGERA
ncbi:MAG: glycosyltransferase [Chitinispirillales bacterium]|jgi:glycosyltransferase involved in cell wall biosynthesis|nr:glycosyltransferase [Chitinispirillales bacterium]